MTAWLRRVLRRPPSVQDCIRRALGGREVDLTSQFVGEVRGASGSSPDAGAASPTPVWRDEVHTEAAPEWGMYLEGCHRSDCDLQIVRPGKDQCRAEWDDYGCWWTREDATAHLTAAAIRTAPCEPLRSPDDGPYVGVVTGPELKERTKWAREQVYADRGGDPDARWGDFVAEEV